MKALAGFFRSSNSRLIVTRNAVLSKILKVVFYVSVKVYRFVRPFTKRNSLTTVIGNFDSNIKLKVDRSRAMGSALYWTGFHEFNEFLFLHQVLKPDMVFVDVGANMGEYTLFAAKRLQYGKVLSFEPLPSMRRALQQNIELNGFTNIDVYEFGLSNASETLLIYEFDDVHEGLATFYPGDRRTGVSVQAKLRKLDDVIAEVKCARVDIVKVDIEGGELKALQGSRSVIARYRPIFLIEINAQTYGAAGYAPKDVAVFFTSFDYTSHRITKGGKLEEVKKLPEFGNIVFLPR